MKGPWESLVDDLIGDGMLGSFLKSTPGKMAVGAAAASMLGTPTTTLHRPLTMRCNDCDVSRSVIDTRRAVRLYQEHVDHDTEWSADQVHLVGGGCKV